MLREILSNQRESHIPVFLISSLKNNLCPSVKICGQKHSCKNQEQNYEGIVGLVGRRGGGGSRGSRGSRGSGGWWGGADVFVPEVGVVLDELAHHVEAGGAVEVDEFDVVIGEEVFRPEEVFVFADDDAWYAIEQGGSGAHDAGAERAGQCELWPIASTSSIANAGHFCVSGGIAGLNAEVVPACDDFAGVEISQG